MNKEILWLPTPEDHDYPAAYEYLSLIFDARTARWHAEALHKAKMTQRKAKDLVRASQIKILDGDNRHIQRCWHKVDKGIELSPILVVRGRPAIIADGFHRLCFVYQHDEDAVVPCKIV